MAQLTKNILYVVCSNLAQELNSIALTPESCHKVRVTSADLALVRHFQLSEWFGLLSGRGGEERRSGRGRLSTRLRRIKQSASVPTVLMLIG
jgi:hypothetical protein